MRTKINDEIDESEVSEYQARTREPAFVLLMQFVIAGVSKVLSFISRILAHISSRVAFVAIPVTVTVLAFSFAARGWIWLEDKAITEASAAYIEGVKTVDEKYALGLSDLLYMPKEKIVVFDESMRGVIKKEMIINDIPESHYIIIRALIKVESNDNQFAVSSANAKGLMQVTKWVSEEKCGIPHVGMYDLKLNIQCGVWWYKKMLKSQNGDVFLALTEYNSGRDRMFATKESREYAPKVLNTLAGLSNDEL